MKILVTGANGQLGRCLQDIAINETGWTFTTRKTLDITDAALVSRFFAETRPDVVINTAAYTAVDRAEDEFDRALTVNRDGVKNLTAALKPGGQFIQVSTDYVFSGKGNITFTENSPVEPQSVYGQTKAEGEKIVIARIPDRGFIVRTSWLYSEYGHNFVKTMLRLGKEKPQVDVVNDQAGNPTYARDLAEGIKRMIGYIKKGAARPGIYHFANRGITTWFEFAREIMQLAGLECMVNPIPTANFPTRAVRPAFSALNTEKFETNFNFVIRNRREALHDCLMRIKPGQ